MDDHRRSSPLETCEDLLAQMIARNSVNPRFGGPAHGQSELAEYLRGLAERWGLGAQLCAVPEGGTNLLLTCEGDPQGPWLLFDSHLDTVAVDGMTVEAFAATARDERISGRGACDTKGSGAAMLWALRDYARLPERRRNVGLIFTVDEEAGMSGARAFAAGALRQFLPTLESIVVGEPTLLRPVTAHNGVVRWKTITRGMAAHSSVPANGRSAISAMLPVLATLEGRYADSAKKRHPLTGSAAFSVNVIRGGTQVNIVPDRCEIECDRRLVPGENVCEVLAERDRCLAGHAVEHSEPYAVPPLDDGRSTGFLRRLQVVLTERQLDPTPQGAPYVTNASHYAAAGAPVIVLGPGSIAQAHTEDEWVARDQLALATDIFRDLMTR